MVAESVACDAPHAGVSARGLFRSFGPVGAVQGMDLEAYPGQVTALVGPNGAGKTTLLLILATLLAPDAGWVRVAGFDPSTAPGEVRARMGWAPDMLGFYDALTVAEYLDVMAAAHRIPAARRQQTIPAALAAARLVEQAPARVHTLSRGQKQRLSLARSLIHGPSVLLLDEPAAGLDPRSRIELHDLLRQLAVEGRTVLVSSHALDDLEEFADQVVFVDRGRTVASHRVDQLPAHAGPRLYRVRTLDAAALAQALDTRGVTATPAGPSAVDVQVFGGEANAARLLAELVEAGVPVTGFGPVGGSLEAAYLQLTDDPAVRR
ncbi:MAG: ABC transporter ATP-binding protein [Geodermatophilaceae bacterium]